MKPIDIKEGTVLGIDVGFSQRKATTCLCLLSWNRDEVSAEYCLTETSRNIRKASIGRFVPPDTKLLAVAIDGPLTCDLRYISRYRIAEALLSRGVFQKRGKPGQTNSPNGRNLHANATELAELLLDADRKRVLSIADATHICAIHEKAIVEAFPNQFLAALIPERDLPTLHRDASDRYWEVLREDGRLDKLLAHLLPERSYPLGLDDMTDHEHRAGFVCALTALAVAMRTCVGVGDAVDGYILLPPDELWGCARNGNMAWMEEALKESLTSIRKSPLSSPETRSQPCVVRANGVWLH